MINNDVENMANEIRSTDDKKLLKRLKNISKKSSAGITKQTLEERVKKRREKEKNRRRENKRK